MVDVEVDYSQDIEVQAPPEAAFALLADVHRSGSHFPGLASLVPVDDQGRWRWTMKEKGFGPVKISAAYDAIYTADQAAWQVRWHPAPGPNDMESYGSWEVVPTDGGALLRFNARTIAHIPAPRMMAKMVDAFVKEELSGLKKKYVEAVAATLDRSA